MYTHLSLSLYIYIHHIRKGGPGSADSRAGAAQIATQLRLGAMMHI